MLYYETLPGLVLVDNFENNVGMFGPPSAGMHDNVTHEEFRDTASIHTC
jgi:hypothetical protein